MADPQADYDPDSFGSPEYQMFARLFEQLDGDLELFRAVSRNDVAENPCLALYPQEWVGPDRGCTLEIGHVEAGDQVHQHLDLYFWPEAAYGQPRPPR